MSCRRVVVEVKHSVITDALAPRKLTNQILSDDKTLKNAGVRGPIGYSNIIALEIRAYVDRAHRINIYPE